MTLDERPSDIILRRLETNLELTREERKAVEALPLQVRAFRKDQDIARFGDRPSQCCFLLDGWMIRYKLLTNGRRQIVQVAVPGDLPDVQTLHLEVMDHNLGTLSDCILALVQHSAMRSLIGHHPRLGSAFWRETLIDGAISREWVVNTGSRDALGRVAHLLCEVFTRMEAVGLTTGKSMSFPMTQEVLAQATGLSPVHINRTLMTMRGSNLITLHHGSLTMTDYDAMVAASSFDRTYLHLRH
jgi:CRP-like cAMP-binding protein